jgi:hypothetical protein
MEPRTAPIRTVTAARLLCLVRYLVTHDTDYSHVFSTALDMERDFVRLLQRIRSKHVVVFLDSCFSAAIGGRTFEGPLLSGLRRPTRSSRSPSVSLKDMEVGEGRMILSECDDWQVAREARPLFMAYSRTLQWTRSRQIIRGKHLRHRSLRSDSCCGHDANVKASAPDPKWASPTPSTALCSGAGPTGELWQGEWPRSGRAIRCARGQSY